jgi:hypothetical protein
VYFDFVIVGVVGQPTTCAGLTAVDSEVVVISGCVRSRTSSTLQPDFGLYSLFEIVERKLHVLRAASRYA